MYLNKEKKQQLLDAALALKVYSKKHGAAVDGSDEWHQSWDDAQACHCAVNIMLGCETDHHIRMLRGLALDGAARDEPSQAGRWLWVLRLPLNEQLEA